LASAQSAMIENRQQLERRLAAIKAKYPERDPPVPDFWGGYRLFPERIEFWQGRENRLHDRFLYRRDSDGNWRIDRLSP
jgi:pyridoxamine 5'-phosphate oxidase